MSEQAVAVANRSDCGNDFDFQLGGCFDELAGVVEIEIGDAVENIELIVGENDAVVTGLGGTASESQPLDQHSLELAVGLQINQRRATGFSPAPDDKR